MAARIAPAAMIPAPPAAISFTNPLPGLLFSADPHRAYVGISLEVWQREPDLSVQEFRVAGYQDGIKSLTHNTADRHHMIVVLKHYDAVCEEWGANALMDAALDINEVNGAFDPGRFAGLLIRLLFSRRPGHAALARLIEILRCKSAAA